MKKSTKKVVIIICCVLAVALIAGGTVVGVNVYNKNVKEQQIEQILSDIKGKYDTFVNESDRDKRIIIIKNLENDLTDYLKNNEPVEKIKEEYQSDLEQMKSYFVTYYEKVISDNTLNEVEKITDKKRRESLPPCLYLLSTAYSQATCITLMARPPREVSRYLESMSLPVMYMVSITLSRETRGLEVRRRAIRAAKGARRS